MIRSAVLALALAGLALPAAAQTPSPAPMLDPVIRDTAGCAAVFMTVSKLAANPQTTGNDPLAGALAGAFGQSFTRKGRDLYARATEEARRRRLAPEAAFEAGVAFLVDTFVAARAAAPNGQIDLTIEAARLLTRCATQFPDTPAEF